MTDRHTPSDVVHRVGSWVAIIGIGIYVLNIGAWVGAADEKFKDAQTVEEKQDHLMLDVNTIQVTQAAMVEVQASQSEAIEDNAKAIEESKKEILAAIAAATAED